MRKLTQEETELIVSELKVFLRIAESLYHEIGSESTIELYERLKDLKRRLDLPEWS